MCHCRVVVVVVLVVGASILPFILMIVVIMGMILIFVSHVPVVAEFCLLPCLFIRNGSDR